MAAPLINGPSPLFNLPRLAFSQHARIRDRDLFILTKITRGPARRVIDRATLCRFIPPPSLARLLSLVSCRLSSPPAFFAGPSTRICLPPPPPRPSIIIPLKPTFHASSPPSPISISYKNLRGVFRRVQRSRSEHTASTVVPEF